MTDIDWTGVFDRAATDNETYRDGSYRGWRICIKTVAIDNSPSFFQDY